MMASLDQIPSASKAGTVEMRIRETRLERTQSTEKERSEDGMLSVIVCAASFEHSTFDPQVEEASGLWRFRGIYPGPVIEVQCISHPGSILPFLTFNHHSRDPEGGQKGSGSEGQNGGREADE